MFESIKAVAARLSVGAQGVKFDENDYRLAAVALLVHVTEADGRVVAAERDRMRALIAARFNLDAPTARDLIRQAVRSDHESADLSQFTSLLRRSLDEGQRRKIVEMLWDIAMADGSLHEFEESLIWRVTGLLGLPQEDESRMPKPGAGA